MKALINWPGPVVAFLAFSALFGAARADTITVRQDGTGDYLTIGGAVAAVLFFADSSASLRMFSAVSFALRMI
jgi:hypothetical protein